MLLRIHPKLRPLATSLEVVAAAYPSALASHTARAESATTTQRNVELLRRGRLGKCHVYPSECSNRHYQNSFHDNFEVLDRILDFGPHLLVACGDY